MGWLGTTHHFRKPSNLHGKSGPTIQPFPLHVNAKAGHCKNKRPWIGTCVQARCQRVLGRNMTVSWLGWLEDSSSVLKVHQHETKSNSKNKKMSNHLEVMFVFWQLCQRTCMLRPWSSYEHLCTVSSIYHLFTYLPWFNIIYRSFSWLLCYV